MAGVDSETLISALDEAERVRLLKGPSGRQDVTWRFAHQLICQTLTRTLSTLRRQRLHLQVAEAMERLDSSSRAYTSGIAHHLYSAGRLVKAARTGGALTMAGDAAHAVYATEEAVQHYHRALEVFQDAGDNEAARRAVQEVLADLLGLLGDRQPQWSTTGPERGPRRGRESIERARVSRKMGALHWQAGDRGQAMTCYRWALQTCEGSAAHLETAQLYQELGWAAFRSGDNHHAVEWAERALESARLALAEDSAVNLRRTEGRDGGDRACDQHHRRGARAVGRPGRGSRADRGERRQRANWTTRRRLPRLCQSGRALQHGEPKRAIDVSLTGLELASKIGAVSLQSYIYAKLAAAYCALTDRCETEGLQAAQAAVTPTTNWASSTISRSLIVIAQIDQCRGELQKRSRTT